ncbi:hypothetical protein [uncultured Jannaschia sp.]|uniref:hypothetical protein n=1 Tax=uncultured Jannaschia sp. TaxID=293347 RepID=UPI00263278F9|nr:hypothetical protein [uncultured Jannaschia sp.]
MVVGIRDNPGKADRHAGRAGCVNGGGRSFLRVGPAEEDERRVRRGLRDNRPRLAQGALDGARWRGELAEAGLAALCEMSRIQTAEDGAFRPPGSNAYGRPGGPARYAQQPLDAWAQVEATLAAHTLTGDADWTREAQRAHAWFLGRNEVGRPLVTPDGGCRDGIDPQGISVNQGAESTLAWLHTDAVMALAGLVPGPVDRHRII